MKKPIKLPFKCTSHGLISDIYYQQRRKSKVRGHPMPSYSRNELKEWIFNQAKFYKLYHDWVQSGFVSDLRPSIDRINNEKGYSFDNIQLVTWKENRENFFKDLKNNKKKYFKKKRKRVLQISPDGKVIHEYDSTYEAEEKTGISNSSISRVCRGIRKTAGGYKWAYKG